MTHQIPRGQRLIDMLVQGLVREHKGIGSSRSATTALTNYMHELGGRAHAPVHAMRTSQRRAFAKPTDIRRLKWAGHVRKSVRDYVIELEAHAKAHKRTIPLPLNGSGAKRYGGKGYTLRQSKGGRWTVLGTWLGFKGRSLGTSDTKAKAIELGKRRTEEIRSEAA